MESTFHLAWVYLDPRFATESVEAPSYEQLVDALADFYDQTRQDQYDQGILDTYSDASVRCGFEQETGSNDGPWYSMTLTDYYGCESVTGCISKYADLDAEQPLWSHKKEALPHNLALKWAWMLATGDVEDLEEQLIR